MPTPNNAFGSTVPPHERQRRRREVSSSYGTITAMFCDRVVKGCKFAYCRSALRKCKNAVFAGVLSPISFAVERNGAAGGSEPSAAGGGYSEVSEWQRSKFPASAVRQRRNFEHRNRAIGPYARGEARCGGRWRLPGGGIGCGLIGAAQKKCTGSDFREIVLCITQ